MESIEEFIQSYIELETEVRELMSRLFSDTCDLCTACCCRADICEESLHSAFLSELLRRQDLSGADLDDRLGWLDLHGCSLEYGRPPVCYAYFCEELLARQPNAESRAVTKALGRLVEYVGENVRHDRHLVEIENLDDLNQGDFEALSDRMEKALSALAAIQEFTETGRLGRQELEALDTIGHADE